MFLHQTNHKFKLQTWMIILTAIILSMVVPRIGLVFKPYITELMMLLMFMSYLNIDYHKMAEQLHHFKKPSLILIIVHLLSPLIVFLLKGYFSAEIFMGLIIVTTVSSGMAVVFLSNLYGGLPSIALLITFFSNLAAPVVVPSLIYFFTREVVAINYLATALTIVKLVIIPLLLAILITHFTFSKNLKNYSNKFSTLILFVVIMGIISPVQKVLMENLELSLKLGVFVIFLTSINFFAGYLLGKGPREKITFGITANYKNYALASIIALTSFTDPMIALPATIYAFVNNLFLIPLQLFFCRKDGCPTPSLEKKKVTKKVTKKKK